MEQTIIIEGYDQLKESQKVKKHECPVCDGNGQIQGDVDYDDNGIPIWNLEKCPQCGGTGKVGEEIIKEHYKSDKKGLKQSGKKEDYDYIIS